LESRIADIYRVALNDFAVNASKLGGDRNAAARNQSMQFLAAMGANEAAYGARRLQAGEDQSRNALDGSRQVTAAGRSTLASTYAAVLGQIGAQRSAAEAAARAEVENQKFGLLQEVARINHDIAVREAMANSGR
jgi:hypothetical protein